MKIESTDLVAYTGFMIAMIGMPFLLRFTFGVAPGWSMVIGFPLGYVLVMAACAILPCIANLIGATPEEKE